MNQYAEILTQQITVWWMHNVPTTRMFRRRLKYRVKFVGDDQPEWKAEEEVNELEAVDVFHERYPDKAGPLPENWSSAIGEGYCHGTKVIGATLESEAMRGIVRWVEPRCGK